MDTQILTGNGGIRIGLTGGTAAKAAAEEGGENVAQIHIIKAAEAAAKAAAATGPEVGIHPCMAVLVIALALRGVTQHLVGLVDLLELGLGLLVAGIQVGVVLLGQLAVGLLDLIIRGGAVYAQHLVVISFIFCHTTHLLVRENSNFR